MLRLAALAAFSFASVASAQTTLYAEALGATGSYTLGIQRGLLSSQDGNRCLSVRAGASYRTERLEILVPLDGPVDHILAIPASLGTTFGLGQQFGVPLSAEFGVGAVFVRRSGGRFEGVGERFEIPRFAEALLGVQTSERVSVRLGALVGGARGGISRTENALGYDWRVQPVFRAGVSL